MQFKLFSSATENVTFDVFMTDTSPGVSVIRDDGHITATRWRTIGEALAYLIGAGCDIEAPKDDRAIVERFITEKYKGFHR